MSRPACRLGDMCQGHCFEPRPNDTASSNVFINGRGCHRLGDHWPTHTCGDSSHESITVGGSSKVFVNGRPKARVGDSLDCGDSIATGSPNVFVGG